MFNISILPHDKKYTFYLYFIRFTTITFNSDEKLNVVEKIVEN